MQVRGFGCIYWAREVLAFMKSLIVKVIRFGIFAFLMAVIMPVTVRAQLSKDQLKQYHSTIIEKQEGKDYYIHTIKRGQTLYMISKVYGVEVNDIIRENPQVRDGIKADEKIRILVPGQKLAEPEKKKIAAEEKDPKSKEKVTTPDLADKTVKPADSVAKPDLPCGLDSSSMKPVYRVALMLPLFLSEVEQMNADDPPSNFQENYKPLQFIQFYEGFMMAVDSLKKSGLSLDLYIYDVDKDTLKTRQLLKKPELKSMDMIIGLLYHKNFQMVADFSEHNKIVLVNPISERSEIVTGNPYVFKVRPAKKSQMAQLAEYLGNSMNRGQILIIRSGQFKERELPEQLKKELLAKKLSVQLVEGQEGTITKLSKDKENTVIAFSENTTYTLDLCRRLYELRNDYPITLVGLTQWEKLEGLETEYLVELHTHYMSPWFVDYDDAHVKQFVRKFHEKIKTDPDILAFQGFDVARYFLTALIRYGTSFQKCLGDLKLNSLQTDFEFSRSSRNNGFENLHWEIYKFENYKLVKVN